MFSCYWIKHSIHRVLDTVSCQQIHFNRAEWFRWMWKKIINWWYFLCSFWFHINYSVPCFSKCRTLWVKIKIFSLPSSPKALTSSFFFFSSSIFFFSVLRCWDFASASSIRCLIWSSTCSSLSLRLCNCKHQFLAINFFSVALRSAHLPSHSEACGFQ